MDKKVELFLIYVAPLLASVLSLVGASVEIISVEILITTLFSIIILQVGFVFHNFSNIFGNHTSKVEQALDHIQKSATAEPINKVDFYDKFRVDVRNADDMVAISYFDNEDPRKKATDKTVKYYEDIKEITESSSDVQFRRLIRANPQLDDWVNDLIETHEGDGNFSLACIPDIAPDQDSLPHIAVQLIDDDITYFVAVGGQQEQGAVPRDLRLRSESASRQWIEYYNRLWDEAFCVMREGRVKEGELASYREYINDIDEDQ